MHYLLIICILNVSFPSRVKKRRQYKLTPFLVFRDTVSYNVFRSREIYYSCKLIFLGLMNLKIF